MAITSNPYIYSRVEWGAENIDWSNMILSESSRTHIVIHHSAVLFEAGLYKDAEIMKSMQQYHLRNGFGDIGYNLLLRKHSGGQVSKISRGTY